MERKNLSLFLAMLLLVCGITHAFANETSDYHEEETEQEASIDVILPDTPVDPGGQMIPVFTMYANKIYDYHDTYISGKYITKNSFPGNGIYLKGKLTYSMDVEPIAPKIRAGIGYYLAASEKCYPSFAIYPTSGVDFFVEIGSVSQLSNNTRYYAYIEDYAQVQYYDDEAYVTGEMSVCYIG